MKPVHLAVLAGGLGLLAVAGYQGAVRLSVNADLTAPTHQPDAGVVPASAMSSLNPDDGHRSHVCEPHEHYSGYVYTPHRYPRTVGGEITNAIHRGYSSMAIPSSTPDEAWMVTPPSEVAW